MKMNTPQFDVTQGILVIIDEIIIHASENILNIIGCSKEEVINTPYLPTLMKIVGEDQMEMFRKKEHIRQPGQELKVKTETQNQEPLYLGITSHCMNREDSSHFIMVLSDITAPTQAYNELTHTTKELREINDALNQSSIVAITDPKGKITYANEQFCKISGYEDHELLGQTHRIINSGYHDRTFFKEMWRTIGSGHVWQGDLQNQAKDGSTYWVSTTIIPFMNENNKPYQYMAIRNDITQKKVNEEKIKQMVDRDYLTSIANRRTFERLVKQSMKHADPAKDRMGLMFIDMDGFKSINDTLGHSVGDELLIQVSKRLEYVINRNGLVARIGGDEFAVFLDETGSENELIQTVEYVQNEFKRPFSTKEYTVTLTSSIGIATYPESALDYKTLMRHADLAMYRIKSNHKNDYHLYHSLIDEETKFTFELKKDLPHALEQNQFYMMYQPKVNPYTSKIQSFESLIRWNHPIHGTISPNKFISIAEETNMINEIGKWVLHMVCQHLDTWRAHYRTIFPVSVNVSANQLLQYKFVEQVRDILDQYQIPPEWIELEITESMLIENEGIVQNTFTKLRDFGIKLAMDDFGTGFSSLGYLRTFAIDTLKIDRSLVQGVTHHSKDKEILTAVVLLGKSFDMTVVAEGAESEEEVDVLKSLQIDAIQGYYYSKPVTTDQVGDLLDTKTCLPLSD